jgi:hypothetical protein
MCFDGESYTLAMSCHTILSQKIWSFAPNLILELILFQAIPRHDVKPIAKALIERVGGIALPPAPGAPNLQNQKSPAVRCEPPNAEEDLHVGDTQRAATAR